MKICQVVVELWVIFSSKQYEHCGVGTWIRELPMPHELSFFMYAHITYSISLVTSKSVYTAIRLPKNAKEHVYSGGWAYRSENRPMPHALSFLYVQMSCVV